MTLFKPRRDAAPVTDDKAGSTSVDGGEDLAVAGSAPVGFGYKSSWLAITTEDIKPVAEALGMTDVRAASWAKGTDMVYAAYRTRTQPKRAPVFLTPVVDGWTLAVLGGTELAEDDGLGSGALDLPSLSHRGEVQKFATHRVVEYQEWQRWVSGSPVRRYCWIGDSGEIRFDDGELVTTEGSILRSADLDGNWDAFDIADEATVMAVGAEWSVDPTRLDERAALAPHGLLGFLARS